jgi:hypothetical protein
VVSRLLADDDAGAGSKLGQQYREGAAEPDHHQPRARLNPARRDRADQLLELRLRLRLDRLARVRRARAFAPQRPADRNGVSYNQWSSDGISVYDAPTVAGSLVYDFSNLGSSRPFIEVGGGLTPYEQVKYSRNYSNGDGTALGTATAVDRDLSLFARVGWLARLTPADEAAVYGDLSRNWMQTGGYSEATTAINPYPETVPSGLDALDVARIGGQYTHLFNGNIEANVSAAVAYGFGAGSGSFVNVYDFGPIAPNALPNTAWLEYGARVGYRFSNRIVVDAFVIGTAFGEVGTTVHGGIGLRFSF